MIDLLVPAVAGVLIGVLLPGFTETARLVLGVGCAAAVLGWALLVWFLLAERAASPGMRAMKLQLVGYYDGRPIGWGRVLLRAIVFYLLLLSGIGMIILLVLMIIHPRHQGWHDQVAQAVMIKERVLAPPRTAGRSRVQEQQPAWRYEPERSRPWATTRTAAGRELRFAAGHGLRAGAGVGAQPGQLRAAGPLLAGARTATADSAAGRRRLPGVAQSVPPPRTRHSRRRVHRRLGPSRSRRPGRSPETRPRREHGVAHRVRPESAQPRSCRAGWP